MDTNETMRQIQEIAASEMSATIPKPPATVPAKLIFVRRAPVGLKDDHAWLGVCWFLMGGLYGVSKCFLGVGKG